MTLAALLTLRTPVGRVAAALNAKGKGRTSCLRGLQPDIR